MQTFESSIDGFYEVGYQMNLDLRRRAEIHFRRQEIEKAGLTSVGAFEAHRGRMRENFVTAIGGLPEERTPLNRRVTGVLDRPAFTVEKLLYYSLPDFPVTAACYVPKNLTEKAPAVVMLHGHADDAKAYPAYQAVCHDLALNGFIVLAIDPLGQGERHQFISGRDLLQTPTTYEHTHGGIPFWLRGASIARHFIWDIMRGIDYLESRPDVDTARIGATGSSGGGLQTCYLMMCEPRLAAAVPCTFPMTLESYQKTGQPQDAEQIVFNCMADGPDHDDFLTAIAPRPVLIGAAAYDFFPIEGALEVLGRAKRFYGLYGKEENIDIDIAPTTHQYSAHLREAAVNWFRLHLGGKTPDFKTESPVPFSESELYVTKSGEVGIDYPNRKTVLDLNAAELPVPPANLTPQARRQALAHTLGVDAAGSREQIIYPRLIHNSVARGYRSEKIFFFSDPHITVTGVLVSPRGADAGDSLPATILLLPHGTNDIPTFRSQIESLLRQGHRVLIFDARGIGAVADYRDNPILEFETFTHHYKLGCDALMLGISVLGLRVFDVLRAYDFLKTRPDIAEVHVHGQGSGALLAYFAAVLETGLASLTCEDMLCSYRDICLTPDYQRQIYNLASMAWGILRDGDIFDHLVALAPRPVKILRCRNALGDVVEADALRSKFLETTASRSQWPSDWQPRL